MELQEKIDKARKHDKPVGMYGLGIWGKGFAWRLFSYLDIAIDFVSDRDADKLNEFEMEYVNIDRITLEELLGIETDTIIFVMIGQFFIGDVLEILSRNSNFIIITLDEIMNLDFILERFYRIDNIRQFEKKDIYPKRINEKKGDIFKKENRIAIYTCIINGYDELKEPLVIEENCDYFLISDKVPSDSTIFQWIDYKRVVPEKYKEPAVINRYCKMHAHEIFSDYRYSIYMDGKVQIVKAISGYISNIGNIGLGLHKQSVLDCIYVEGMRMTGVGYCDEENIVGQMRGYIFEGMPRNFGTFECRVVVRDHSVISGNRVMEQWFKEYYEKEKRDQISLSYVLWKNGLDCNDVGLLNNGLPWKDNKDIECRVKHLK